MRAVDYIIVGQGLAGSCLALELVKRKKRLLLIDAFDKNSASRIAAGIFNPITGRTNQPTWLAEGIFKSLSNFYSSLEKLLSSKFLNRLPIYRPFVSGDENGRWPAESNVWIQNVYSETQFKSVNDQYGGILIRDSGFLETNIFLDKARGYLQNHCDYDNQYFEWDDYKPTSEVHYHNYTASGIIFCEGCNVKNNHLFDWLPVRMLKGELLTVKGDLPHDVIINRGVFSLPIGQQHFILGSTYVHDATEGPTSTGRDEIMSRAKKLFNCEMQLTDQSWGHRPTTPDRRPLLGCHPDYQNVCIFNGLGTKGVSLAPFFALHLADWLEGLCVLNKEVNIERFYSLSFKSKSR